MPRTSVIVVLAFVLTATAACRDDDRKSLIHSTSVTNTPDLTQQDTGGGAACVPIPTDESMLPTGPDGEGRLIIPGGRTVTVPERSAELGGFPSNVIVNSAGTVAYLVMADMGQRRLGVVNVATGEVLQDLDVAETMYGVALDEEGDKLYLSGGSDRLLHVFDVADDGTLTHEASHDVDIYISGLDLSADRTRLFAGSFTGAFVAELDVAALGNENAEVARYATSTETWDVRFLPDRNQILVSTLHGRSIQLIDRANGTTVHSITLGQSPLGMDVTADESVAYVAVSGINEVVAVDLDSGTVVTSADAASDDLIDADGEPYGRSNLNDVALSPDGTRLYATRGADNAVSVYDTDGLTFLGAFPVSWYPTAVAVTADSATVLVAQGRGFRTGGLLGLVPIGDLDLEIETPNVRHNMDRMREVFPFECDGVFPIPTRPDLPSPIEHVILVVKENKTFDCVFGALEGTDGDPTLVRWDEEITPNQHALARQFNISDNFYVEAAVSDQGHIILTAGILNEYSERMVNESRRTGTVMGFQVQDQTTPQGGNLFTHLLDHGIEIAIYGQIVGMFAETEDGRQPMDYSDRNYPGGPFYNMNSRDTAKAQWVVDRIEAGDFPPFVYMLLPNDHTGGVAPGNPTPEAEVADNDEGVGLLVDYISHSEHWDKTVIIILQDDPQGCRDHVDGFRSALLVISPWARRNYVSHVNASYQSVFATIYRILGVPPLGRPDAVATPLWDFFTNEPDFTPYERIPRRIPEEVTKSLGTPGAEESMRMDFRGPDRNIRLGIVLDAYRLWRMGRISSEEAQQRIDEGIWSHPAGWDATEASRAREIEQLEELLEETEEEAEEEVYEFDRAMEQYRTYLESRGEPAPPSLPGGPLPEELIRDYVEGRISPEEVRRLRGFTH